MSLEAMVWALKDAPVTDPLEQLVLIGLADHARPDGTAAWPSQKALAAYARVTDRTVRTKLRALEEAGLIAPGDGRLVEHLRADRRPQVWDLAMAQSRAEAVSARKQGDATGGSTVQSRAEAGRRHGRNTASDRTVLEPSIEPSIEPSSEIDAPGAREDVEAVCSAIADHVAGMTGRRPTISKAWRRDARLMLDRDGHPLPTVLAAVAWVAGDGFWAANILCPRKLREKWPTLEAQSRRAPAGSRGAESTVSLMDSHQRLFGAAR